jgi:3-phenylpropionate/trans-cinnamate dioxygenase ferredoxin subunit
VTSTAPGFVERLFRADELAPGAMRAVNVRGKAIVVVRAPSGRFFALRNRCPHAGAELARGLVEFAVVGSEAGEYVLSDDVLIRCPWHGWEFAVTNGQCLADPRTRVRTYRVSVRDGYVELFSPEHGVPGADADSGADG